VRREREGIHFSFFLCMIPFMYQSSIQGPSALPRLDMPGLLDVLARNSARPRYAFMVLNLIAKIAGPGGSAGPTVLQDGASMSIRDWLCDALMPMGRRDPKRIALAVRVREELMQATALPDDPAAAEMAVDREIRDRLRASGKTNVSRAVSDLVRAGLLVRHYQGYCVDHHNRGGQRQAVYTLTAIAWQLLRSDSEIAACAERVPRFVR
jgi:hypothetical protein